MNKNLYRVFLSSSSAYVLSAVTRGLIQGKNLSERAHWSLQGAYQPTLTKKT